MVSVPPKLIFSILVESFKSLYRVFNAGFLMGHLVRHWCSSGATLMYYAVIHSHYQVHGSVHLVRHSPYGFHRNELRFSPKY